MVQSLIVSFGEQVVDQVEARGSKHALIGPGMSERLRAMVSIIAVAFFTLIAWQ